jgi:hypothetical protein
MKWSWSELQIILCFDGVISPYFLEILEEFEDTKGVIRIRISKIPKGGNQNPYIEEEQTTQCPKEKERKKNNDLQNIHIKLKID